MLIALTTIYLIGIVVTVAQIARWIISRRTPDIIIIAAYAAVWPLFWIVVLVVLVMHLIHHRHRHLIRSRIEKEG
jgi:hypothetical protein